jgi:hypothetical protein
MNWYWFPLDWYREYIEYIGNIGIIGMSYTMEPLLLVEASKHYPLEALYPPFTFISCYII